MYNIHKMYTKDSIVFGSRHKKSSSDSVFSERAEAYVNTFRQLDTIGQHCSIDDLTIIEDWARARKKAAAEGAQSFQVIPVIIPDNITPNGGESFSNSVKAFTYSMPSYTAWLFSYLMQEVAENRYTGRDGVQG